MMNKVKITAVRKTEYPDLMARYENPILHTCDVLLGQNWISVDGKRPEGMCESAWGSMREFVAVQRSFDFRPLAEPSVQSSRRFVQSFPEGF